MSAKQTAWRKVFGAAGRACRREGKKPGTPGFGTCMREKIKRAKAR